MIQQKDSDVFGKKESQALKGIAIMMMLFHHCFLDRSRFGNYEVSFFPFTESNIVHLAYSFKICVSIFAFITGYGLFLNINSNREENATKWAAVRYIKTFSGFWFVWVLSAAVCQIIDGRFWNVMFEDGVLKGCVYTLVDFLGLANLFNSPTLNSTWWYMSAAALFIILTPLVYYCRDNILLILIGTVFFIRCVFAGHPDMFYTGGISAYPFLTAYLIGCIFARYKLFNTWICIGKSRKIYKIYKGIAEIWILILAYKMYQKLPINQFWEFHYGLYPMLVILFCVEYIVRIPGVKTILRFLGRYSMDIFLIHTFIRYTYLQDFTYSFHHFALIVIVLLTVSLTISIIIEAMKKMLNYNALIERLIRSL